MKMYLFKENNFFHMLTYLSFTSTNFLSGLIALVAEL